ncbi:hypothetical protein ACFXO9_24405 [Nocardia tengchongensis]|uniref:hypothetical protein n=1 Tax=Nocardia tengchongensis TaxID=2055889 RepID=UPI0036CF9A01
MAVDRSRSAGHQRVGLPRIRGRSIMKRYAIGFLRREVSGACRQRDEAQIHALAEELGYCLTVLVLADQERDSVLNRLMNLVWGEQVNEVIAPRLDHFESGDIPALVKFADVICADTRKRYTVPTEDGESDPNCVVIREGTC